MEYINLHIVTPMTRLLIDAGCPFLDLKYAQGSVEFEILLPSSDQNPIDIKMRNIPTFESMTLFLERCGQREDDASDGRKSWLLDLSNMDVAKQFVSVLFQAWFETQFQALQQLEHLLPQKATGTINGEPFSRQESTEKSTQ